MENVNPERKFTNFPKTPLKKEFQGESLENYQEKQIFIDNLKINYKQIGNGDIPIILLHGWGLDSNKYLATAKYLFEVESEKLKVKSYRICLLDLPGFGKSDNPPAVWGVDEYAELVRKFIMLSLREAERRSNPEFIAPSAGLPRPALAGLAMTEKKVILIGHSFGGQITIKFAAKYPEKLKALILTGAAGIRHQPAMKQKIFYYLAKTGKIIFSLPIINRLENSAQKLLYRAAREKDYYEAQGVMREIFKKVIKEDLTSYLEKIKTPTLLVWGRNDRSTPLKDGELMHFKIQSAGGRTKLEIISEANHSLPYQFPEKFAKIAGEFIKKQYE